MSQEAERVYTVRLSKVLLTPDNQRAKRAINMVKEFARHHMKTEDVRIEEDLSHLIWKRGIKHPPRKVRVRMVKTDEGFVLISPYEEGTEAKVEETETKAKAELKEVTKPKLEVEPKVSETETPQETIEEIKSEEPQKETIQKKPAAKETKKEVKKPAAKEIKKEVKKPAAKETKKEVKKPAAKETKKEVKKPAAKETKSKKK